jgi:hypothetical protein
VLPNPGIIVIAAVTGVLVAGCGAASESDRHQVGTVTRRFLAAFANGNGKEACSLLTDQAQQRLFGETASRTTRPTKCPEQLTVLYKGVTREFHEGGRKDPLAEFRKAAVAIRSISAHTATARVTFPGGNVTDLPLSKTAQGWRISGSGRCVPSASQGCSSSL